MKLKTYLEDIVDEWIRYFDWTSFSWIVGVSDLKKIRREFDTFEMLKLYLSTIMYQGEREDRSTKCIERIESDSLKRLLFKNSKFEPFFDGYIHCPALAGGSGREFFFYVMRDPRKWCAKTCILVQKSTSKEKFCPIFRLQIIYAKGYMPRLWPRILSSFIALCIDLKRYNGSLQEFYNDNLRKSKPEELTKNLINYFKGITVPKGASSDVEKIADLVLIVMSHPFFGIGIWKEISYENLFPVDVNIEKFCREMLGLKGGKAKFRIELLRLVKVLRNNIRLLLKRRESKLVDLFSKLPMEFRESWKNPKCYTRIIEIGILYYYKNRGTHLKKTQGRGPLKELRQELFDLRSRVKQIEKRVDRLEMITKEKLEH